VRVIALASALILMLLAVGTAGYTLIEGWPVFDSLYMTITTLATVGFGEVHPMSNGGRAFTMLLILGGAFTVFWAAGSAIAAVASGELGRNLRRRRMERRLEDLNHHVIVCGYGRMGRRVAAEFEAMKMPFVVIERDGRAMEDFSSVHGLVFEGDATSDEVLRRARVDRARALVTVVASDADNLMVTMSARLLNDKLYILARAEDEHSESKLARAGATRVISPYKVTAYRAAQAVVRPTVVDFVEVALGTQHLDLQMEEMRLVAGSPLVGKTLAGSRLMSDMRLMVIAIKKGTGKMVYNPPAETLLEADDVLILVGHPKDLEKLELAARA
jgi:voltage-gated potassium channel